MLERTRVQKMSEINVYRSAQSIFLSLTHLKSGQILVNFADISHFRHPVWSFERWNFRNNLTIWINLKWLNVFENLICVRTFEFVVLGWVAIYISRNGCVWLYRDINRMSLNYSFIYRYWLKYPLVRLMLLLLRFCKVGRRIRRVRPTYLGPIGGLRPGGLRVSFSSFCCLSASL